MKNQKGFSLIELSIALMIIGITMSSTLMIYEQSKTKLPQNNTSESLGQVRTALETFVKVNGRYPCPARITLKPGDPDYGKESCPSTTPLPGNCVSGICRYKGANATSTVCGMAASENLVINLSTPAGEPFTGVSFASYGTPNGSCGNFTVGSCHATSSIANTNTAFTGKTSSSISSTYTIFGDPCVGTPKRLYIELTYSPIAGSAYNYLTGGIPFVTLKIPEQYTLDGWKNKITYIVTELNTNTGTYSEKASAFTPMMIDEDSNMIPKGFDIDKPPHAYLISHGENGEGAYTQQGVKYAECNNLSLEYENCNNDAKILISEFILKGKNKFYYDDMPQEIKTITSSMWTQSQQNNQNYISANTGIIGIRTDSPNPTGISGVGVDVSGAIYAEDKIKSGSICDKSGNNCFMPEVVTGSGYLKCNSTMMTGISQGDEICDVALQGVTAKGECAADEYMTGINAMGIICAKLP